MKWFGSWTGRTITTAHNNNCGKMHSEAGGWLQSHANSGYRTSVNLSWVYLVSVWLDCSSCLLTLLTMWHFFVYHSCFLGMDHKMSAVFSKDHQHNCLLLVAPYLCLQVWPHDRQCGANSDRYSAWEGCSRASWKMPSTRHVWQVLAVGLNQKSKRFMKRNTSVELLHCQHPCTYLAYYMWIQANHWISRTELVAKCYLHPEVICCLSRNYV